MASLLNYSNLRYFVTATVKKELLKIQLSYVCILKKNKMHLHGKSYELQTHCYGLLYGNSFSQKRNLTFFHLTPCYPGTHSA